MDFNEFQQKYINVLASIILDRGCDRCKSFIGKCLQDISEQNISCNELVSKWIYKNYVEKEDKL